jgi:hypothetical protein
MVFVGLIFIEVLFGPPPSFDHIPRWLIFTTLLCLLIGYFLGLVRPALKRKKDSEKINNIYLMTYGQSIPVDLNKCDVIENSKTESILVYKYSADNKTETFSTRPLPFDKSSLLSKIQSKKQTYVYVDNKDRSKYYFDIDFIYN